MPLNRVLSSTASTRPSALGLLVGTILLFAAVGSVSAQTQFQQKVITTNAEGASDVHATDLNGDSRSDILAATDSTVVWYENEGGRFPDRRVIGPNTEKVTRVYTADLTGNSRPDILSVSGGLSDSKIAWYQNQGDGRFAERALIATNDEETHSLYATDLTGNGRPDVLAAAGDKIVFFENQGSGWMGGSRFSEQKIITSEVGGVRSIYAADLTGNGTSDVLSASVDTIAWYENQGVGRFSGPNAIARVEGRRTHPNVPQNIYAADLTGEGLPDVLIAAGNEVVWYANRGDGRFSGPKKIATNVWEAQSVHAADLTGNGALDVLSASSRDNRVAWYENRGSGRFSEQNTITREAEGAVDVYAADLTGDGPLEVLSASLEDAPIAWYDRTGDGASSGDDPERTVKEQALIAFADYAPTIEKEEGPITYHRSIQGDLTGDGRPDVLVEFGIGAGGMKTIYKQVAIYENTGQGVEVVGGFEPEYCPSIKRVEKGTVVVKELTGCASPDPETTQTHRYVLESGTLQKTDSP